MSEKEKRQSMEQKEKLEQAMLRLGFLQRRCREAGIPVLITFDGYDAAGKGLQINRLIQAFDPRGFDVYTCDKDSEEELLRPFLWRFAVKAPAAGRIVIFDTSWYRKVQMDRFDKKTGKKERKNAFEDILAFEKQLADGGVVLVKLLLTISEKEQKKRFKALEASKETAWRVSENDWKRNEQFEKYEKINQKMQEETNRPYAPWTVVKADKKNEATLKIMNTVAEALEAALVKKETTPGEPLFDGPIPPDRYRKGILAGADLSPSVSQKA